MRSAEGRMDDEFRREQRQKWSGKTVESQCVYLTRRGSYPLEIYAHGNQIGGLGNGPLRMDKYEEDEVSGSCRGETRSPRKNAHREVIAARLLTRPRIVYWLEQIQRPRRGRILRVSSDLWKYRYNWHTGYSHGYVADEVYRLAIGSSKVKRAVFSVRGSASRVDRQLRWTGGMG